MTYRILLPASFWLVGCWSFAQVTQEEGGTAEIKSGDQVKVVEIVKGDELVVEKGSKRAKVRLLGILAFDTEIQDPALELWRQRSVVFLRQQILEKKVLLTLDKTEKDTHGRYLAYVERAVGDQKTDINRAMVSTGLSMVYTEYGFARETVYLAEENAARAAKKNLWSQKKPADTIRGLRGQWARFRAERDGAAVADPLLAAGAQVEEK